jgi:zinc transport system substrate-binding protein
MRIVLWFLVLFFLSSCRSNISEKQDRIITVSIAPFKYFVEEIGGADFVVNIMVPAGSNPHIYEPFPDQINKLRKSVAYISNGYLGFEMTWLDRFYETNKTIKRLSLGDKIDPLVSSHHHEDKHVEGADPHYWVSPKCAFLMASSIKEFLCELNPAGKQKYESNYQSLLTKLQEIDTRATELFSGAKNRSFMIFHPNLGYLARDYGLEEISVEYEGKEPPPSRMKDLIDRARKDRLKTIFVQREYDTKNAKAIADEIGAKVEIIDPLSEDWHKATLDIIIAVSNSLNQSSKLQ